MATINIRTSPTVFSQATLAIVCEAGSSTYIYGDVAYDMISMSMTMSPSMLLVGDAIMDVFDFASASISQPLSIVGDIAYDMIESNYGIFGDMQVAGSAAHNFTVVLNLRTKAHSLYDSSTFDAWATTGEITFDSRKDKTVPDIFVFGRSDGSFYVTATNDEATSRKYEVVFEQDAQGNLKNKKRALSKGLKGTNWKFKFSKEGQGLLEVRSADLNANELRRHT
jgi:hypothetical protein